MYIFISGATPFATVSSRISQHFKRAAEHNPPRPPILTKHIDQNHSRKINYSLATEPISSSQSRPETGSSIDNSQVESVKETNRSKIRKSRRVHNENNNENHHQLDGAAVPAETICHPLIVDHGSQEKLAASDILMPPTPPHTLTNDHEQESDGECSDYHEDMLKGDIGYENHAFLHVRRASRRQSHVNERRSSLALPSVEGRKPSFSINNTSSGEQEFWTPFSFEQDFDNLFLQDASIAAHSIPFNIDAPESVSVSELDNYFDVTSPPRRSQRKSFCASMPGSNDKSLLQKVLLASAARGVAEKKEEDQSTSKSETKLEEAIQTTLQEKAVKDINKTEINSDMMSGEDFVKFDDEEPLPEPPLKKLQAALPTTNVPVSTAEILKSMNIQNLNLSALHSNAASSSQKQPPAFDLTKTMAAYLRALAKSANENSSSSSTLANDLKSILTRFPALEAYLKKEPTPPQSITNSPPLQSPTAELVPNLVQGTDPIVHSLMPMQPPMYITVIDMVAVCVVILEKTNNALEYRIMRRLDNGFVNGTVLLTAGGIETESERSMILSFEMERVRVPKKESKLFGTWIPLRRAQELAVTCSLQNKLDRFLNDDINSYFPDPLPIQINSKKTPRDSRWASLALAALRNLSDTKSTGFSVPPISQSSSCSYNASVAQLQQLLMNNPQNALKSSLNTKNPLLGNIKQIAKCEPCVYIFFYSPCLYHLETANPRTIEAPSRQNSTFSSSQESQIELDFVNNSDLSSDEDQPGQMKQSRKRNTSSSVDSNITKVHESTSSQKRRRKNTGNSENTVIPPALKDATDTSKRQASGGKNKIPIKQENLVVEHKPSVIDQKPDPVVQSPILSEDEDIDIGGSDCDDDLR